MRKIHLAPISVALLTLIALALRFWRLGDMPLFADEAYYLLWAGRLAPAYFDHPAGVALLLRLSTALGDSEFDVRWLNALLSAACVPLSYAAGRRYVNLSGGLIAAAAVALAPVYVLTSRVVYPDALQYAFLLLNLLVLARVLTGRAGLRYWALFGITLALLTNVKLSGVFYLAALAVYVLLWRRELLREPGLWLAGAVALAGVTPLLGWNLAHGWAGVRWALYQGQGFGFAPIGLLARLAHAVSYHTVPAVLLASAAIAAHLANLRRGRGRESPQATASSVSEPKQGQVAAIQTKPARQETTSGSEPKRRHVAAIQAEPVRQAIMSAATLLALAAVFLLVPVLFSAADNPRNLGIGLLPLWPLAGLLFSGRRDLGRAAITFGLLAWLAIAGAGSAAALLGPTALPHSPAASAIRGDAAGWPVFAREFAPPEDSLIYAVDYSIAGQVSYYTGRSVYSSGGQFRIWGIPEATDLTVLSQGYIPPEVITGRLRSDFARVEGPLMWEYTDGALHKTVFIWQANGRTAPMAQVVEDLDYIALAREINKTLR